MNPISNLINAFTVVVFCFISLNADAQSIYEKAAKKYNSIESEYTKHKLATSAAHAYVHNEYVPETIKKIVYSINSDDRKTKKIIEKLFAERRIQAVNLMDITCNSCTDEAQLKQYLNNNEFTCLVQITLTSKFQTGTSIVTNFYQTNGDMTSVSDFDGSRGRKVTAIFEWYDSKFENLPFLKSEVTKITRTPKYYSLVTGDFAISINVPIKRGLLKIPTRK